MVVRKKSLNTFPLAANILNRMKVCVVVICNVKERRPLFCSHRLDIKFKLNILNTSKVKVGNNQETVQSERNSHSKNRGGKIN